MQKSNILYGVLGLVLGALITIGVTIVINNKSHSMEAMMADMTKSLEGKTGDDFDKAFIQEMIVHHQGAISMAGMALVQAKHPEIKILADQIITAQTDEMTKMESWMSEWYDMGTMSMHH